MKPKLFSREMSEAEQNGLKAGLRSQDAFILRRSQIILSSAEGRPVSVIAKYIGCHRDTVRRVINTFNLNGRSVLKKGSRRPHRIQRAFTQENAEKLKELIHRSPRDFEKPTGLWTLKLLAEVSFEQGLTEQVMSNETVRGTLKRLDINWKRAKHWITSPDPHYEHKKKRQKCLIEKAKDRERWAFSFQDEVWWSRLTHPDLHSWTESAPLRLEEQVHQKDDPDPKAFACYGLDLRWNCQEEVWIRFVEGNPKSDPTIQFMEWVLEKTSQQGILVLLMFWDHASWHKSKIVRTWLHTHNQQVKHSGAGTRLLACLLPKKSPWLNPIEPRWIHAKRKVTEPGKKIPVKELAERVCQVFEQPVLPWITTAVNVP